MKDSTDPAGQYNSHQKSRTQEEVFALNTYYRIHIIIYIFIIFQNTLMFLTLKHACTLGGGLGAFLTTMKKCIVFVCIAMVYFQTLHLQFFYDLRLNCRYYWGQKDLCGGLCWGDD